MQLSIINKRDVPSKNKPLLVSFTLYKGPLKKAKTACLIMQYFIISPKIIEALGVGVYRKVGVRKCLLVIIIRGVITE